ncbi:short-chain fatty acids transporter [Nannocystis exedens]|uniref:Short-chain fatty acids transporter n=1 Tax=Nannocystis exedens TaxID=54 RepID=A0A1I2CFV2_9BACT|nr:TIGR00366 family protein [Nannocystis exedens]PCC68315.1 putative short-chain fatty acids transporter [Nannocystis exedens]SFE67176.1 short-chain fatty acids transporter [Nannocystis exedens]
MRRLPPLVRLGLAVRRGFGRFTPDPFVVAVGMTLVTLVAGALAVGDGAGGLVRALRLWSAPGGLWSLLAFAGQMALMLTLGTALAAAPPVRRGLEALARLAAGPRRLVGLVAFVSCTLCLFNWSLGLVCGAMFARTAGDEARRRGLALHYPLLCAAGYAGMMVWHGGLSGTAPLKATTLADLTEVLGPELAARVGPIALSDSLLGGLNLAVTGGLWLLAPLVFMALTPAAGADPDPQPAPPSGHAPEDMPSATGPEEHAPSTTTGLDRLERSPLVVWALALPAAAALAFAVGDAAGPALDLNAINLALWVLALVLHGRPDAFVRACDAGARASAGILLLFPLYGGIMGVMKGTGLAAALAGLFAAADPRVFTTLTFVSAGFLNLFIPSGGGQWAVQGPIVMSAALERGVDRTHAMLAIAYGDQWTNMLQPFWAVPLLAITGVRARDIIGYCTLWMFAGGLWIAACLLLASL